MTDNNIALSDDALAAAQTLLAVAARRAELDAAQAKERQALADRELAARVVILASLKAGDTGTDDTGTPLVTVKVTRRFSAERAAEVLPDILGEERYRAICSTVTKVDSRKAKEVLAPALYALAQTESAPTVVLA